MIDDLNVQDLLTACSILQVSGGSSSGVATGRRGLGVNLPFFVENVTSYLVTFIQTKLILHISYLVRLELD